MSYQLVYTPEGGSKRTWDFDPQNPPWDLAYVTENETGWPWLQFLEKLAKTSYVAWRALIYAFRKRDEPRLTLQAVTFNLDEVDMLDVEEPQPKLKAVKGKTGEA